MAPYRIPPTRGDIVIANAIADHTSPQTEQAAELLTWGADEHVLLAIAATWRLYCYQGSPTRRRNSDHILATTLAVSVLPHLLKSIFDQRRPDRLTVRGHLHGVPVSGKANDAFPSGHAMHVGALASAASVLPPTGAISYGHSVRGWCLPGSCCWRIGRATSLPASRLAHSRNGSSASAPDLARRSTRERPRAG